MQGQQTKRVPEAAFAFFWNEFRPRLSGDPMGWDLTEMAEWTSDRPRDGTGETSGVLPQEAKYEEEKKARPEKKHCFEGNTVPQLDAAANFIKWETEEVAGSGMRNPRIDLWDMDEREEAKGEDINGRAEPLRQVFPMRDSALANEIIDREGVLGESQELAEILSSVQSNSVNESIDSQRAQVDYAEGNDQGLRREINEQGKGRDQAQSLDNNSLGQKTPIFAEQHKSGSNSARLYKGDQLVIAAIDQDPVFRNQKIDEEQDADCNFGVGCDEETPPNTSDPKFKKKRMTPIEAGFLFDMAKPPTKRIYIL